MFGVWWSRVAENGLLRSNATKTARNFVRDLSHSISLLSAYLELVIQVVTWSKCFTPRFASLCVILVLCEAKTQRVHVPLVQGIVRSTTTGIGNLVHDCRHRTNQNHPLNRLTMPGQTDSWIPFTISLWEDLNNTQEVNLHSSEINRSFFFTF